MKLQNRTGLWPHFQRWPHQNGYLWTSSELTVLLHHFREIRSKIVSLVRHLKYLNFLVTTSNVRFGLHWTIIRGSGRIVVVFASHARWVSDVGCFLTWLEQKSVKSVRMLRVFETCSTTERGKVFAWVERCLRLRRGEGKACEAWAFFLR